MKNKGFTLIELMATITLLGILVTLGIVSVSKYLQQAREGAYTDFEKTLKSAATNYLIDHTGSIPDAGGKLVIDAEKLRCDGYITPMKDPKNSDRFCNTTSYVVVERKSDVSFNMDVTYHVCLTCGKYQSGSCTNISINNLPRLSAPLDCK